VWVAFHRVYERFELVGILMLDPSLALRFKSRRVAFTAFVVSSWGITLLWTYITVAFKRIAH
jgi:hypothetical protein